jgi:hypothetical protein
MKINHSKSNKKAVEKLKKMLVKIRIEDIVEVWGLPKLKKPVTVPIGEGVLGKRATPKQSKMIFDYAKKVLGRKPGAPDIDHIFRCDKTIDKYEGHYMRMFAEVF